MFSSRLIEKHILSPIDTESTFGVFAWSACDHEARGRFVAVEREKPTLVANMKQYATMRARQEELRKVIKHTSERQGKLRALMERKKF